MFTNPDNSRLTMLRTWVLDNQVTAIVMNERQFWNFAALQPVAEKHWATFMGRQINVHDMPDDAQHHLCIFAKIAPGVICAWHASRTPHGEERGEAARLEPWATGSAPRV